MPVLPVSEPACVQVWALVSEPACVQVCALVSEPACVQVLASVSEPVSDDGVQQVSAAEEAEPGCDDVSAVAAELEPLRKNRDSKRQLT